jgi:hypothetical protein
VKKSPITIFCPESRYGKITVFKDVAHLFAFLLPIFIIVLDDTQAVNSEAKNAELAAKDGRISERSR